MLATPRFSEDSLYKSGVVNRTDLTKNQLNSVEPNRPDCYSIGNNRAEIFRWVRLIELVRSITEVNNRTRLTRLLRFCLAKRQNPSSFNWIKFWAMKPHIYVWPPRLDDKLLVWLHSSVGRASHRYRGGHGLESHWSPDFFRLLLSNCLNWKIYCDDHTSLWSTTAVQNMNYFINISKPCYS